MFRRIPALLAALCLAMEAAAAAPRIVAAERVYGDIAARIAGPGTEVASLLTSTAADPHEWEAPPSAARALAAADIAIVNGLGFDPWAEGLLRAADHPGRTVLVVSTLAGLKPGANPHCWFDLDAVRALARALAAELARRDPAAASAYQGRLAAFLADLDKLDRELATLRKRFEGVPVATTESLADDLFRRAGLRVVDTALARAAANDTEPAAADIGALEEALGKRAVRLLLVNRQVASPLAARLEDAARNAGVPLVDITEMMPLNTTYVAWIGGFLGAIESALSAHG